MRAPRRSPTTPGAWPICWLSWESRTFPAPAPSDRETLFLSGSGDLDFAVNCSRGGFFVPGAALGEHLAKGRTLGTIRDLSGKVVEEIVSPEDGFVVIIRATPVVFGGEFIAALSEKLGDRSF